MFRSPREVLRIAATVAAIPDAVRTVIDVGAGDGRVAREIYRRGCKVVALDLSQVALSNIQVLGCCGSAHQLPFSNQSFDLVLSTEMLEHLPEELYSSVLSEISRVAGQYILISVPNTENLNELLGQCDHCGCRFHVWRHVRSYTPQSLRCLFPGFHIARIDKCGDYMPTYNPILLWIRQRVAGGWAWEEGTPCYRCNRREPPTPRWPFLIRLCDALNIRFWARFFKRQCWLLALFERNEAETRTAAADPERQRTRVCEPRGRSMGL